MLNYDFIPCEECCDCAYYWQNTDTENECVGEDKPCHEFIEFKGIGHQTNYTKLSDLNR